MELKPGVFRLQGDIIEDLTASLQGQIAVPAIVRAEPDEWEIKDNYSPFTAAFQHRVHKATVPIGPLFPGYDSQLLLDEKVLTEGIASLSDEIVGRCRGEQMPIPRAAWEGRNEEAASCVTPKKTKICESEPSSSTKEAPPVKIRRRVR